MKKKILSEKNKFKQDKNIKMHKNYDKNHVYLINGKSHLELGYKSVTAFRNQFFEEFDAEKVIEKYYKLWQENEHPQYFGLSKEEIILFWEINRDKGTAMHRVFEEVVNDKKTDKDLVELPKFIDWYKSEVSEPFRTECTVYGAEEMIIGNIDFIYINRLGEICIVDYKHSNAPENEYIGRMCIGIDMPDTKSSKHTLQLNLYKYLLEKYYELDIKHIYNLYIKEDKCEFVEQDIVNLDCLFDGNGSHVKYHTKLRRKND